MICGVKQTVQISLAETPFLFLVVGAALPIFGPGHTMSEMTATITSTHSILRSVKQGENGVYRVVVDLSFIAVPSLRSLWTSQESSSRQFVC